MNEKKRLPLYGVGPIIVFGQYAIGIISIILFWMLGLDEYTFGIMRIPFKVLGVMLIAFGCYLDLSAKLKSRLFQKVAESKLITDGVYGLVRNPVYSGALLETTGVIFIANNFILIFVPVLCWIYMSLFLKFTEEKWLYDVFGEEYIEYCKTVNRCIPWIKKAKTKKSKLIRKIVYLAVMIALFLCFAYYQNNAIEITEYTYESNKIAAEFDGFTIVQISDFHNASFRNDNKNLVSDIKKSKPDIIVLTGDLVDVNHTDIKVSIDFSRQIAKLCPVYYVTGNHEEWLEEETRNQLLNGLEEVGVVVLRNEAVSIKASNSDETITLIGLQDASLSGAALSRLTKENEAGFNIVLAHEPQYLKHYAEAGADLVLSGHAHGGQFVLPYIGGVYAPDQGMLPTYTDGKYVCNDTTMYVSRGLGNSVISLRVFNHPEIVKLKLKSSK